MSRKTLKTLWALVLPVLLVIQSCRPEEKIRPAIPNGNMKVQFDYAFGANQEPWELGKMLVHPKTGDTLTFTMLKFYVSNIRLKKQDGTWWAQPESYYLVDVSQPNGSVLKINDVPAGTYTAMEYTMGVDSARNVSGVQTGALSVFNGMYWDWNSGYIMLKAEGESPNSSTKAFVLHLGGFKGEENIVTTKTTDFGGTSLTIANDKQPVVKLLANPGRFWHSSPGVDSINTIHMPGPVAKTMAKDFYDNITFNGMN